MAPKYVHSMVIIIFRFINVLHIRIRNRNTPSQSRNISTSSSTISDVVIRLWLGSPCFKFLNEGDVWTELIRLWLGSPCFKFLNEGDVWTELIRLWLGSPCFKFLNEGDVWTELLFEQFDSYFPRFGSMLQSSFFQSSGSVCNSKTVAVEWLNLVSAVTTITSVWKVKQHRPIKTLQTKVCAFVIDSCCHFWQLLSFHHRLHKNPINNPTIV